MVSMMPAPIADASDSGTLRIAILSEPNSLDPVVQTQGIESFIEDFVFDALFKTHADGSIESRSRV